VEDIKKTNEDHAQFFDPVVYQVSGPGRKTYDTNDMEPRPQDEGKLKNVYFAQLAKDIKIKPRGEDRGIFTQVVEYAAENPDLMLDLDDVQRVADEQGFVMPSEAAGTNWDKLAAVRAEARFPAKPSRRRRR
jgi:hypothetical protein